jgi:hypothetical protein
MGLADLLKRLVRGAPPPPPPATRLSEAEAIELAKTAAGDHGLRRALNVATAERSASGAVLWTVRTNGVGSFIRVVIDDANGTVLECVVYEGR